MTRRNRQFRLAARPVGLPKDTDWEITEEEVREPAEGEVVVGIEYISLDPAMRGWMNEGRSYIAPVGIGEVMRAGGVGHVVESRDPRLPVGTAVQGTLGVQEYAVIEGRHLMPVDESVAPLPAHLGVVGMPGLTAYFGLLDIGRPEAGQTVVVSGAAGAVGQVVGQIARIKGCRVVGIAGGPEKCAHVTDELGFDACIDYKAGNVAGALREACPDRIDVYFDNVGGEILDAALSRLHRGARVVLCGAISQYNATERPVGPRNYMALLVDRASMTGFVVFDFASRYAEGVTQLGEWVKDGRIKHREDILTGFENFPEALLRLFRGENLGKQVLQVAD